MNPIVLTIIMIVILLFGCVLLVFVTWPQIKKRSNYDEVKKKRDFFHIKIVVVFACIAVVINLIIIVIVSIF